ncbi:MAG: FIST C-terminal domain-containing protein [Acidaminococcaceae bacterium]|jgi:hypothetical protein|nr:FIST C-terminal domain-containing protein [Acidaminococcaceae bacterium]
MQSWQGYSKIKDVDQAVAEACAHFPEQPQLVFFFSESERFPAFTRALGQKFAGAQVIGASSFVSFSPAGASEYGLQVAALTGLQLATGVLRDISTYPLKYKGAVTAALQTLAPSRLTAANTCCFILNAAGSNGEELVLDTLAEALEGTAIPVCGGSASSPAILQGQVSLNGQVLEDSTVFAFLHLPQGRIHIQQENIFTPLGKEFTVTRADVVNRIIYELDGHKAADVLSRALKLAPSELPAAAALHPVGRVDGDSLFVSEIKSVNQDGSITTYCRTFNQTRLAVLKLADIAAVQARTLAAVHQQLAQVDFSLVVNCYSRTCMYQKLGIINAFARDLQGSLGNYLGLTSYGEQYHTFQCSLTMLIVSLGAAKI